MSALRKGPACVAHPDARPTYIGLTDGGKAHLLTCSVCERLIRWPINASKDTRKDYRDRFKPPAGGALGDDGHDGPPAVSDIGPESMEAKS